MKVNFVELTVKNSWIFRGSLVCALLLAGISRPIFAKDTGDNFAPSLAELSVGARIDIEDKENEVLQKRILHQVTNDYLEVRVDEFDRSPARIQRRSVFRVICDTKLYSDIKVPESSIRKYENFTSFMKAEMDYVTKPDYRRIYGLISTEDVEQMNFRADDVEVMSQMKKTELCEWRRAGVVTKNKECADLPSWLNRFSYQSAAHPINLYIHTTGPINLIPQLGLGVMSNPDQRWYVGLQGGGSGPLITSGWYYLQANPFLKLNLGQWDYWRIFIGYGFSFRTGVVLSNADCGCDKSSSDYYSGTLNAKQSSGGHVLSLGMRYQRISFELGIEIRQYTLNAVDFTGTSPNASSIAGTLAFEEKKKQAAESLNTLNGLAVFYYSVTFQIR